MGISRAKQPRGAREQDSQEREGRKPILNPSLQKGRTLRRKKPRPGEWGELECIRDNKQTTKAGGVLGEYAESLTIERNLLGGKAPRSEQHRNTRMTFV